MQSAVSGLMQAFKAEFATDGTDWDNIPYDMHLYGSGGIGCWGTLCGIPNGCVALSNMIGLHGSLGGEILGHYSETEWPTSNIPDLYTDSYYGSGGTGGYTWNWQPVPDDEVLAHVTPFSPLCHVSISKWCYAAGVDLNDTTAYGTAHKNDRCAKICADMAAFTAELINYWALHGSVESPYVLPAATASCKSCHWKVSDPFTAEEHPAQCGKMDCAECHSVDAIHSGLRLIIEDVWTADGGGTPKNTFTASDPIQYKVRFHVLGGGSCYVKTYRSKAKDGAGVKMLALKKNDTLGAATYDWTWSDSIGGGDATGTAKVIMKLQMFDYKGGGLLDEQLVKHKFTIV